MEEEGTGEEVVEETGRAGRVSMIWGIGVTGIEGLDIKLQAVLSGKTLYPGVQPLNFSWPLPGKASYPGA
jgi:hypothetical protein